MAHLWTSCTCWLQSLRSAAQGRLRSRVHAHANVCILLAVSVASIRFQKCNLNKQILWFLCSFSIVELQVTTNGVVITANIYYLISISQCLSVVQPGLQPVYGFKRLQSGCRLWLPSHLRLGVPVLAHWQLAKLSFLWWLEWDPQFLGTMHSSLPRSPLYAMQFGSSKPKGECLSLLRSLTSGLSFEGLIWWNQTHLG